MQKDHYWILFAWESVMCIGYIVKCQVEALFAVDSECLYYLSGAAQRVSGIRSQPVCMAEAPPRYARHQGAW